MDSLSEELLLELECPVCIEYMIPPITLCENGHNICSNCKAKMERCPTCYGEFTNIRCFSIERLARKAKYPCKYQEDGCNEAISLDDIPQHHEECIYQPLPCPFSIMLAENCKEERQYFQLADHIKYVHPSLFFDRTNVGPIKATLPQYNTSSTLCWHQVQFMGEEIFLWFSKSTQHFLYSSVLYVGPKLKAPNFKYSITIETVDQNSSMSASHMTQSYISDLSEIIKYGDCPAFDQAFIKKCINDNEVEMKISIWKISS